MHPRYSRVRQTRSAPKKASSWLTLFFSFTLGYLFAYILNLETLINLANNLWYKNKSSVAAAKARKPKPETSTEPKYEFYTMLQRNDGEIVQPDIKAETSAADPLANKMISAKPQLITPNNAATAVTTPNADQYVVQIAAFNNAQDAESLKAKLALQGYQMQIVPVAHGGSTVYRVISQDFQDQKAAEVWLQKFFTNAHLHGILRKKETISR